jgi:hypothetical protein
VGAAAKVTVAETSVVDALASAGAANTATNSAFMVKMAAGPRGLYHPPQPHADDEGWKRLNGVVPWYVRHHCRDGAGVPAGGYEGVTTPYPILVTMADAGVPRAVG